MEEAVGDVLRGGMVKDRVRLDMPVRPERWARRWLLVSQMESRSVSEVSQDSGLATSFVR